MLEGNLLYTDPPQHRQPRKLVNTGFTRRQVAILEPKMRAFARVALDRIDPDAGIEFAEQIAAPLPTRMIAELLGAPDADWEMFRTWSDATAGINDPEVELGTFAAMGELYEYFGHLIALRRDRYRRRRDSRAADPRRPVRDHDVWVGQPRRGSLRPHR